ncbi:MAG: hypothetical protein LC118_18225 [Dehalococcoidia bacterium]|nr:hypothetical protein [Dehalococcoidia bacterium]
MNYLEISTTLTTPDMCSEFVRSRRASAGAMRVGTPSLVVVMIERLARGFRHASTAIEGWAAGTSDPACSRQLSIR